jgi:hypothetical protein
MRITVGREKVSFLSDGKLFLDNETHQLIFEKGFCVENFYRSVEPNESQLYMSAFLCIDEKPIVVNVKPAKGRGCYNDNLDLNEMNQKLRFWLTVAGFISIFFLFLTLSFYLTLPGLNVIKLFWSKFTNVHN